MKNERRKRRTWDVQVSGKGRWIEQQRGIDTSAEQITVIEHLPGTVYLTAEEAGHLWKMFCDAENIAGARWLEAAIARSKE